MIVLPEEMAQHLGENPFEALMNLQGEVYRKQPLRETARVLIQDKPYFIKKHFGIRLSECLKNIFSGRMPVIGAAPEWKAIQALQKLGIKTTPLVAYGQRGAWPFTQQSFILTESLENTVSLEEDEPDFMEKRQLIKHIARITRMLHEHGWVHRDLYLCHFLKNTHGELSLIDLHRMIQPKLNKQRWVIKDLAALLFSSLDKHITRSDVLRFLKVYGSHDSAVLQEVVKKARELYLSAHNRLPDQKWMRGQGLNLPVTPGSFDEKFDLADHEFQSLYAFRVLQGKRWVIKGLWNGQAVVLKLFTSERDFHKELCGAQALEQHKILSPKLLCETKLDPYFAVVYEFIDNGEPISEVTPKLLSVIKKMHESHLLQTDCHRENFLCKNDDIYVLDAGGVVKHECLTHEQALDNLALLYAQWPSTADAKHLLLLGDHQLQQAIGKHRAMGRNTWLKKIFRNCTAVRCKTRLTQRVCVKRDFDTLHTKTLLAFPDAYFHDNAIYLKKGNSATVVRVTVGEHDIVIKRFNRKNLWIRLKRYVTPSKAARAWKMAHAMESMGIKTPRPLAFIEKRFGPFRLDSYYVCAFTPGERLDHLRNLESCQQAINDMMAALAQALCQHGDLKASNILWDGHQLILLDTDAAKIYKNSQAFDAAHQADWARLMRNWERS